MRKQTILSLCCSFFLLNGLNVNAQFAAFSIPAALKENADVVVRREETNIILKSESSVTIRHKYAYTILNSAGDDYAQMVCHYDKLRKVQDIDGTLYNALGIKIKSLKKNEIKDYSNTSESELADDNRVKVHNFGYRIYPYTVEYESTEEWTGSFILPPWQPVARERLAVEKSIYTVETYPGYKLRHKDFNYSKAPVVTDGKNSVAYSWELNNYNAVIKEPYLPAWHEITPTVFVAPSTFEMQKYTGSMNDWGEFGLFIYKLNSNRDVLPEKIKQTVHSLTDNLTNTKDKINVLYKYLQKNTRYISIQLGIGGWQTLDAGFVASNGYGDCKALNNYMYAMLKEAGIKSYYTLVYAGRGDSHFIPDFTINQFNHIILCVPQQKDTTWLECTNQIIQPGYLGSFTSNRPVLLIDEKGGVLVKTPAYTKADNLQVRKVSGSINDEGLLEADVHTSYRAEQQDYLFSLLHNSSKLDIDDFMKHRFSLPSYEVNKFTHEEVSTGLPTVKEDVSLAAKNYASVSGKRMFVNPNVLSVSSINIKNADTRKYDFNINDAYTDHDTIQINIPAGYKAESIPQNMNLEMPLAQYKSTITLEAGKIIYTRSYTQSSGRIPASEAKNVAGFFDKIYKADRAKIVFVKETN